MPHPSTKRRYQRALYWPKTGMVHGEPVLGQPEELRVRWEWNRREIRAADSSTIALDAQVFANQSLAQGSYLWLAPDMDQGALAQWHGAGTAAGWDVVEVVTTSKTPDLRNRSSGRTANCQRARDYIPGGWGLLRIPGLELWLHADYNLYTTAIGTARPSNAGSVGRWTSLDRKDREFKQSTNSLRPSLRTSGVNGRQVVDLGDDKYLEMSGNIPLTGDFVVYAAGEPLEPFPAFALSANDSVPGKVLMSVGYQAALVRNDNSDEREQSNLTLASGAQIARWTRESNIVTFTGTGQPSVTLGIPMSGTLSLGVTQQGGAYLRHVLIFSRVLTSAERKMVEDYLAEEVGVQLG